MVRAIFSVPHPLPEPSHQENSIFFPLKLGKTLWLIWTQCSSSDAVWLLRLCYKMQYLSRFLCLEPRHPAVRKSNQAHVERPFGEAHVERNQGHKPTTSINHCTCEWISLQKNLVSSLWVSQLRPQVSWSRASCPICALSEFPTHWIYKKQRISIETQLLNLKGQEPQCSNVPLVVSRHTHIGTGNV